MKDIGVLKHIWINLVSKYSESEEFAIITFNQIREFYTAPGRFYHTLNHIFDMLIEIYHIKHKLKIIIQFYSQSGFMTSYMMQNGVIMKKEVLNLLKIFSIK